MWGVKGGGEMLSQLAQRPMPLSLTLRVHVQLIEVKEMLK